MTKPAPRDDQKLQITLLQERSTGTFARVYLAEARGGGGLSRVVAVKVIKEQWSESHEILTRTRDEARLLARLQHKNILRVEALAEVDGQPAIVMEFVDGLDLQQLIERLSATTRRIPRRALYKIMADATSAIAAAWEEVPLGGGEPLRVVHRDLKPSNVMVSKQGEVKVLDFGTARFDFTERQARTGAMRFGSLKYMSPERRQGDRGEHQSDVYALGLLCIEMLRGEMLPVLPLEGPEHDTTLQTVIDRLGDLGLPDARWDDALRQTLRGMVAADPGQRLHASQLIPLFRAFADNATGESLDAFAADTVAELSRQVHGGPARGDLAGSRVFVATTTSGDLPVPSAPTTAPVGAAMLPEDPAWGEPDRPTQVTSVGLAGDRHTDALGMGEDEPPTMVSAAPASVRAVRGAPLPVDTVPAHSAVPADSARPAAAPFPEAPSITRPSVDTLPPPAPARPAVAAGASSGGGNLVAGLVAALVVFVLGGLLITIVAAAAGAWYWTRARPVDLAPPAAAQVDPGLAEAAGAAPADGATFAVQVEVDDDLIQWIALQDGAGERVFKGTPGGSAELPAGEYTLQAKVRARGGVERPLSLAGPLHLRCLSADKGEVHCQVEGGEALVLAPAP